MESPVNAPAEKSPIERGFGEQLRQSFAANLDLGGRCIGMDADCVVVLDAWATANAACLKWSEHHGEISERWGAPCAEPHPESARSKFG